MFRKLAQWLNPNQLRLKDGKTKQRGGDRYFQNERMDGNEPEALAMRRHPSLTLPARLVCLANGRRQPAGAIITSRLTPAVRLL
jgi:hypothetical protein